MSTKQSVNLLTPVQTDDYKLVQIATGIPCFVDDCIRLGNGQNTRFLDGGTAPNASHRSGTIIHSNRAGVDKHADFPDAYGLVWLKKVTLTDKQYSVLLDMFHEFPDEFKKLPMPTLEAYYSRLYAK